MPSIDETAQSMFGLRRMNPMMMLQTARELSSILNMMKGRKERDAMSATEQTYSFSGQHTDIAFVSENGSLNADVIESIPDEQLRDNVIKCYSDAVKDGYLNYDQQTKNFTLTDKGNEHINSEEFLRQFESDQLRNLSEDKAYVQLKGNASDLNVFRYTDSISLNHLAHSDPAAFKRVQEYFYECQKYDLVTIDAKGNVRPTEKCQKYLEQNHMEDFNIKSLNKDNIEEILKQMPEGSKKLGEEAAKKATEEAAKKAGQEATKKAAQKAAAQASSKAAASAASGAASMGIGTAVSAVVDVSSKGANALTKMDTQSHKATMYRS